MFNVQGMFYLCSMFKGCFIYSQCSRDVLSIVNVQGRLSIIIHDEIKIK